MARSVSVHAWSVCGIDFTLELWSDVFMPTSTTEVMADVLAIHPGDTVIDLGCGSGFFSILAAKLGASRVYAVDVMPQAVKLTLRNAKRNGVISRIQAMPGSLFAPLPRVRADLVIDDVSGIAEDVARATPWYPRTVPSGGPDGAEPTVAMLRQVTQHLLPEGRLIFPVLSLANEQRILDEAHKAFATLQLRAQRVFPIPVKLHETWDRLKGGLPGILRVIQRGSRRCWELRVFEARMAA